MKKELLVIFLLSLLIGCNSPQPNGVKLIITKINKHPFLVDHQKKLTISDSSNNKISEIKLYGDPGAGCNSYLYKNDSCYVIIDCNGAWYFIDHSNGSILDKKWNWEYDVPQNYIGTYIRSSNDVYELIEEDSINIEDVYKFKEPIVGETI